MSIRHNALGTLRALSVLLGFVFFFSACNGKEPMPEPTPAPAPAPQEQIYIETLAAGDVDERVATLNAKLVLTGIPSESAEWGFYWGTSEETQDSYIQGGPLADDAYFAHLTNLSRGTQYWYKACVKVNGETSYGEVKTFTTAGVAVTGVSLNYTEYGFTTIWGSVLQLEATVSPSNATDKSVSWKSSNESVATVDQNGMVYVQGYGEATITVTTNDEGKTATCTIYVSEKVMSITLDKTYILLLEGEETTISVKSIFPDVADKSYTWSSTDPAVASVDENGKISAKAKGTATIKATANDGGGAYGSCTVQVSDGTVVTPDAVDLGLSVKWGSFNLGASAPEERGWYYAWGEILDKTSFSWSNYRWCQGTMDSITKYIATTSTTPGDGRLTLETADDVARTKLGVYWRMPTKREWQELMRDCTWEWTKQSGVFGFKVTSKISGYTDNSIFIPAAGYIDENGYHSGSTYVVGYYWTYNLCLNTYDAYSFECGHSYADNQNTITSDTNIMRCYGVSIRPVLPE